MKTVKNLFETSGLTALWKDEEGMGTIEVVIIIFVLIGLGFLFKTHIEKFFTALVQKLNADNIGKDFNYK